MKLKKLGIMMSIMALSITGIAVQAATFDFDIAEGTNGYSEMAKKSSNGSASVDVENFNRSVNNVDFRFVVVHNNKNYTHATEPHIYNGKTDFIIPYSDGEGIINNEYRIRGRYVSGSVKNVETNGTWTP